MIKWLLDLQKEKGNNNQAYKMLKLLDDTRPQAFDQFVLLLQEDYDWLAKDLQDAYKQKHLEHQEKRKHSLEGNTIESWIFVMG